MGWPAMMHYTASIQGENMAQGTVTYYQIAVAGCGRTWLIQRRYNDFHALHNSLSNAGVRLPRMSPKSTFRKAFFPSFMMKRQADLQNLLQTAIAADPTLQRFRPLQDFLGVNQSQSAALSAPVGVAQASQALRLPQAPASPVQAQPTYSQPIPCPPAPGYGGYPQTAPPAPLPQPPCAAAGAPAYAQQPAAAAAPYAQPTPVPPVQAYAQPGPQPTAAAVPVFQQPASASPAYPQPTCQHAYVQPPPGAALVYGQQAQPPFAQPPPAYAPAYAQQAQAPVYAPQAAGVPSYGAQPAYQPMGGSVYDGAYDNPPAGGVDKAAIAAGVTAAGAGLLGGMLIEHAIEESHHHHHHQRSWDDDRDW